MFACTCCLFLTKFLRYNRYNFPVVLCLSLICGLVISPGQSLCRCGPLLINCSYLLTPRRGPSRRKRSKKCGDPRSSTAEDFGVSRLRSLICALWYSREILRNYSPFFSLLLAIDSYTYIFFTAFRTFIIWSF